MANGSFGQRFLIADSFQQSLQSLHNIDWPLSTYDVPDTLDILDLIQFCHKHVAKRIEEYNGFKFDISYDIAAGRDEFREEINLIFYRNGLVYELQEDGSIIRIGPPILRETLIQRQFDTNDSELDQMLEEASRKALDPNPQTRREAVERLWHSWERLKTIENPIDKKKSITKLLDQAASEPTFRNVLETEANELTKIGNNFQIRHYEISKPKIEHHHQSEYLFYRLLNLIWLLLRMKQQNARL